MLRPDDLDLAQWYHILSIETEYDFAPDGWGPFDVLSGFVRLEVRYDCVWKRACGIFPSADAFGDRVSHLPGYKTNGHRTGFSGNLFIVESDAVQPLAISGTEAMKFIVSGGVTDI